MVMGRLHRIPDNFNYAGYRLDAVVSNGTDEPIKLPQRKKEPIRLKSLVEKVESRLLDMLYQSIETKEEDEEKEDTRTKHKCTACDKTYFHTHTFRNVTWIQHSLQHIPVDRFHCHLCNYRCRTPGDIKGHLQTEHFITQRSIPSEVTNFEYTVEEIKMIDAGARKCFPEWGDIAPPIKDLSFLKKENKKVYGKQPTESTDSCDLCGMEVVAHTSKMYEAKEEHTAVVHHPTFRLWKCNQCSFGSPEPKALPSHFKKEHPEIEFNFGLNIKIAAHPERREFSKKVLQCFPNTVVLRLLR